LKLEGRQQLERNR